jgi:protein-tyrosine phosphatase
VLTATRHQRAVCVSMVPEMVASTFTMRQFGRMLAAARPDSAPDSGPDRPAALRDRLRRAVAARSTLQPVAPEDDDLPDPVREPIDAFRRCADAIDQILDGVLGRLIAH